MAEQVENAFATWAVVEVMGHRSFGGYVTEQQIAGTAFVRVDVPEVCTPRGVKMQAYTKLFGAGSIYCISPCTEEVAQHYESHKSHGYDELRLPALPGPGAVPPEPVTPEPMAHLDIDDDDEDQIEDDISDEAEIPY